MRPQQNRRMRGRGNNGNGGGNNRKGPNPLTRSYESNGPDVKIRGSAQQIAEKYTTLARDAQSSGDRVMAENYLQHAEHYNRIIMAAQAQMPQQQVRERNDDDDLDDDESFTSSNDEQPVQHHRSNGSGPQPVIDGTPAEVALKHDSPAHTASAEDAGAGQSQQPAPDMAQPEAPAEEAPRRARKPRRPRTKAAASNDDDQAASSDEEPVTEAAQ